MINRKNIVASANALGIILSAVAIGGIGGRNVERRLQENAQPQVPIGFRSIYGNGIILKEKDGTYQAYTTTNGEDYVKMDRAFLANLTNSTPVGFEKFSDLEKKTSEAVE